MQKIAIIVGTRPEAIKLIPVYLVLSQEPRFDVVLISTGQHREMLNPIFEFFDVLPSIDLRVMSKNQTLNSLTANLFVSIGDAVASVAPDLLIVQGDTTSALVGAMTGYYNKIPVAHVEAGLRTHNKWSPFPEEMNRQMITRISDLHFAPTDMSAKFLKNEGIEKIIKTGNTVIDSLLLCLKKVTAEEEKYSRKFSEFLSPDDKVVLITGHRRESFGDGFLQICQAIEHLSKKYKEIKFVYPVHMNPNVQEPVNRLLCDISNLFLINPVPYDEMVYLMSRSYVILTDSGGIQEEAPSLGKPLIVMRDTTERPEGIEADCALLTGNNKEKIIEAFEKILHNKELYGKMSEGKNPYGDGKASILIRDAVKEFLNAP